MTTTRTLADDHADIVRAGYADAASKPHLYPTRRDRMHQARIYAQGVIAGLATQWGDGELSAKQAMDSVAAVSAALAELTEAGQ